ncbi:serine palmitoyltransferase 1-like [Oppia nitens]|uniref:serine palmitoyltransferase 1-like n=1 Tax=Oppia nitens TaxID=1686743 RepID=UPI0023DC2A88|nr:serine palmitoyltransferase 1-like [Oppia nitens]
MLSMIMMSIDMKWELKEMMDSLISAPKYHLALEGCLLMCLLWLIFHKSYKPEASKLTEKEKEDLINEWTPEPLVPETPADHYALNPRIVTSKLGKRIVVDGTDCLNLATHNYLGFVENDRCIESAIKGLRKYGVGSCGPRGFYGTVDIHLELESRLAKFMGVEEAVLYSYGFSAISSAIPAYSKVGDLIFVDEGVNFAIQQGLLASRSKIKFFKHNDVEDLHRLLSEQADIDRKNPKKAKVTRRFLVVEGLYINYGDICPLPQILELKKKYKVRMFIDDTCGFGVLGANGRGVVEHFGVDVADIDMICATLENSMAAYGGFCCGTSFIVDHQRLSGLGYCFSASLPPLQAAVALSSLDTIERDNSVIEKLRQNCQIMHSLLKNIPHIAVFGQTISPVKHLRFANQNGDHKLVTHKLEKVVTYAQERGYALTVSRYLDQSEHLLPEPSIRLIVNAILTEQEMKASALMIGQSFEFVLN